MSMIITQDIKPFVWEKLGLFINLNFFKNFIKKFSKSYHTAKHSYNFAFDVIKSQRDVTNISTIFLLTSSLVDIYEKLKNTLYHHNQKTRFFCPATFQKPTKTRKPQASSFTYNWLLTACQNLWECLPVEKLFIS